MQGGESCPKRSFLSPDVKIDSLQLDSEIRNHFVEDEHFYYFDDMYSLEYSLQWMYEDIIKYDIDEESRKLLEDGNKEIMQSECYQEYGLPMYIHRLKTDL